MALTGSEALIKAYRGELSKLLPSLAHQPTDEQLA